MTPIEEAARALCKIAGNPSKSYPVEPGMSPPEAEPDWERFVPQVRMVLTAVQEASVAMVDAGNKAMREEWAQRGLEAPAIAGDAAVAGAWFAMIDAALDEGPTE